MAGFSQAVTVLHPGEYAAADDDVILATVLGSCVSVCLFDAERQCGGLNHFMLPGCVHGDEPGCGDGFYSDPSARYGVYAMELLINELFKRGCRKSALVAKVFGGAVMLGAADSAMARVPRANIAFALEFLAAEGIRLAASDVGGNQPRKVLLFPAEGRVLVKKIRGSLTRDLGAEERAYRRRLVEAAAKAGDVVLF
jgi:chemotaxis protein CheD